MPGSALLPLHLGHVSVTLIFTSLLMPRADSWNVRFIAIYAGCEGGGVGDKGMAGEKG